MALTYLKTISIASILLSTAGTHATTACNPPESLGKGSAHMSCRWFGQDQGWNASLKKTRPFIKANSNIKLLSEAIRFDSSELSKSQGKHIQLSLKAKTVNVTSSTIYVAYKSVQNGKVKTEFLRPSRIDGLFVSFQAKGHGDYQLVSGKNLK